MDDQQEAQMFAAIDSFIGVSKMDTKENSKNLKIYCAGSAVIFWVLITVIFAAGGRASDGFLLGAVLSITFWIMFALSDKIHSKRQNKRIAKVQNIIGHDGICNVYNDFIASKYILSDSICSGGRYIFSKEGIIIRVSDI